MPKNLQKILFRLTGSYRTEASVNSVVHWIRGNNTSGRRLKAKMHFLNVLPTIHFKNEYNYNNPLFSILYQGQIHMPHLRIRNCFTR